MAVCLSCLSNTGERRISPGVQIYNGSHWVVEHTYPTGLLGWLAIVLKRHSEELHDLSREEWVEFGEINYNIMKALQKLLSPKKEYLCCFAESRGFEHIHFHVIPKTPSYDESLPGTHAFRYLQVSERNSIDKVKIKELCAALKFEMSGNNWE
jgi:diadenosine tetraphosphate (Ap4A) HIT family hydrolase